MRVYLSILLIALFPGFGRRERKHNFINGYLLKQLFDFRSLADLFVGYGIRISGILNKLLLECTSLRMQVSYYFHKHLESKAWCVSIFPIDFDLL